MLQTKHPVGYERGGRGSPQFLQRSSQIRQLTTAEGNESEMEGEGVVVCVNPVTRTVRSECGRCAENALAAQPQRLSILRTVNG